MILGGVCVYILPSSGYYCKKMFIIMFFLLIVHAAFDREKSHYVTVTVSSVII